MSLHPESSRAAFDDRGSDRSRDCDGCGETFQDLRRCKECAQAWYCSKKCQTGNWSYHKFTCQPHKVTTADQLARAVRRDLLPQDPQTRKDYGFDRAEIMVETVGPQHAPAPNMLFGLYVGLLKYQDVLPSQLHKWRKGGVLIDQIKQTFEAIPAGSRGGYYAWFLQNQNILDPQAPAPSLQAYMDDLYAQGWRYMGGSALASPENIQAAVSAMSQEDADCFKFVSILLSRSHPSPAMSLWVTYGFCVCVGQYDEMQFAGAYQRLLHSCTFAEFKTAYKSSNMAALFDRKKVPVNFPCFRDVMKGSPHGPFLSVWYLKAFVMDEEKAPTDSPTRSVYVDYGFINCKSQEQRVALHDIYRRFFDEAGDPIELHAACLQGSTGALFTFVTSRVHAKDEKTAKMLREVMYNVYPLA